MHDNQVTAFSSSRVPERVFLDALLWKQLLIYTHAVLQCVQKCSILLSQLFGAYVFQFLEVPEGRHMPRYDASSHDRA